MYMDRRFLQRLLACTLIIAASISASGCATAYVDGALKDVRPAEIHKPLRPQDAQVLFTFQTKGTGNAKATELLRKDVMTAITDSGIFATAGSDPSLSGAILGITINNVPLDDSAFAKGFATALTLGLAGNVVTDGYICTVDFIAPKGTKVTKTARHAIHTTVGAKGAPANAVKAKSLDEAVHTVTRQVVLAGLKNLADDAAFQ